MYTSRLFLFFIPKYKFEKIRPLLSWHRRFEEIIRSILISIFFIWKSQFSGTGRLSVGVLVILQSLKTKFSVHSFYDILTEFGIFNFCVLVVWTSWVWYYILSRCFIEFLLYTYCSNAPFVDINRIHFINNGQHIYATKWNTIWISCFMPVTSMFVDEILDETYPSLL